MEQDSTKTGVGVQLNYSYVFYIVVAGLIAIFTYTGYWLPRQECLKMVNYTPARGALNEGYYKVGSDFTKQFKTRDEAVDYCMRNNTN